MLSGVGITDERRSFVGAERATVVRDAHSNPWVGVRGQNGSAPVLFFERTHIDGEGQRRGITKVRGEREPLFDVLFGFKDELSRTIKSRSTWAANDGAKVSLKFITIRDLNARGVIEPLAHLVPDFRAA